MKLLSVAAFSAVLVVPCFANAKVSVGSPNLPFPRDLGRSVAMRSPNLPFRGTSEDPLRWVARICLSP